VDFINCKWSSVKGRRGLYDETVLNRKSSIEHIKKVERLYRRLKQKYKEEHDEAEVSNWHRGEKEMQRRGTRFTKNPFLWLILNLYRWTSGYGEEPVRAGLFLLMLICLAMRLLVGDGLVPLGGDTKVLTQTNSQGSLVLTIYSNPTAPEDKITLSNAFPDKMSDLFSATLAHLTFDRNASFKPASQKGNTVIVVFKILITIQATLFAFALRNRFRR
jgi:hypothetical protein